MRLVEDKRGFARAELLEVIAPAPNRITPRCKHFAVCGGCHYQHLAYEDQLAAKEDVLKDLLYRIGKMSEETVAEFLRPIVPSPTPWYYRNHVQFHLDANGKLGYKDTTGEQVVAIEECHLPEERLNDIWPLLELEPIPELQRISLRGGDEDEIMLVFETETDEGLEFELDVPLAAVQTGPDSLHVLSDSAHIEITILGQTFQVTAGTFFQVNTAMAEKMVEHVMDLLAIDTADAVVDIYCGVGLFSAFIAAQAAELIGIEANPLAVDDFSENMDAFENVTIYEADAKIALEDLEGHPDAILVDPPRAGLDRKVLDAIVELQPTTLVYVSCDPSTMARDAKRLLAAGFVLEQLTPFDMFPQTYHIETIGLWHWAGS